jgi:hypothetical protein
MIKSENIFEISLEKNHAAEDGSSSKVALW